MASSTIISGIHLVLAIHTMVFYGRGCNGIEKMTQSTPTFDDLFQLKQTTCPESLPPSFLQWPQ